MSDQQSKEYLTARLAAADSEAARLRKMLERFVVSPVAGFGEYGGSYQCKWCKAYKQAPWYGLLPTYSHKPDCLIIQARAALADVPAAAGGE